VEDAGLLYTAFSLELDYLVDWFYQIVQYIKKAIKAAQPFFDWLADQAVAASAVNVVNNSDACLLALSI